MPTPVSTAKQCLNADASSAFEGAVAVARRRGHAQTTSLHAVSAFLSLSPSQLREACVRARNAAFYPRVQLRALDLCLSAALERLPTSQPRIDEPPVSNSLMAAIKRSQANQRRQPESIIAVRTQYQLLGQCHEPLGSSSGVKVELQHLIVSILDDPIVSRVFTDAGFRSFDVKLAILRPFQSFFGDPHRNQNVFLCNFDGSLNPGYRPFRFPFYGSWENCDGCEDYRRIGEVLVRKKGRNPLLFGVCAGDALRGFVEVLERGKELNVLPLEVRGIKVVSIEKDVLKFVSENWSDEAMNLRFKEMGMMVEQCVGPGLMVNFGNLRCFLGGESGFGLGVLNSVVRKLTKLVEVHGAKVWLIGFAANDQTYMEFVSRFPSIDKDWDLHLLPITSVKPLMGGESCFKSSLMGSFVPFGGFFSSPSDLKGPLSSSYQLVSHHDQSNGHFEQETSAYRKRAFMASVADQPKNSLAPWLQMAEAAANNAFNDLQAKGGNMLLGDSVESLQRKWDSGSQHLQHTQSSPDPETCRKYLQLSTVMGSNYFQEKAKIFNNEQQSTSQSSNSVFLRSSKNDNFLIKLSESPPRTDHSPSSSSGLCISGVDDTQTSPSGVSVVTELGLELFHSPSKQQKKGNPVVNRSDVSKCWNNACFDFSGELYSNNFKTIFEALFGRVGRQSKAVRCISQIIADTWTSNGTLQTSALRGDVWLNCIGSDLFGKRKLALALSQILYGSEKNFIHVDFYSRYGLFSQKTVFGDQVTDGSDLGFRSKTAVDHIAEELRKTPFSVVFIENVHFADPMAQRSLSQAIKTGRFAFSYGGVLPINNRIFVLATEDSSKPLGDKPSNFIEERISRAKVRPVKFTIRIRENIPTAPIVLNKRKQAHRGSGMSLDLNLPAELNDDDNDERTYTWLEEFSNEVDKTLKKVFFDPLDYDSLATKILEWVHLSFSKAVGFDCSLEIEPRVMEQVLASACLSERSKDVEDWIDRVLGKGFEEARKRHQMTVNSVVTVSSCGPLSSEEQDLNACLLPSKIILT